MRACAMANETIGDLEPPGDGYELETRPGSSFPHPPDTISAAAPGPEIGNSPNVFLAATPSQVSCSPSLPQTQARGKSHGPLSSIRSLLGRYLSASAGGLKQRWERGSLRNYLEAVAFAALLMAGVALWPTGARSSKRRLTLIAQSGKKHLVWGNEDTLLYEHDIAPPNDVSLSMLLVALSFYPVCAFLWVCIHMSRRRKVMLQYYTRALFRGLSYPPRRLYNFYMARNLKVSSNKHEKVGEVEEDQPREVVLENVAEDQLKKVLGHTIINASGSNIQRNQEELRQRITPPKKSNQHSETTGRELACHYYNMNPKQHSTCVAKTFPNSASLMEHLRTRHSPRGPHSCNACFQPFPSEAALHTHTTSGVCRPTGGVYVDKLPTVVRRRGTLASRWYVVWQQLFPDFERPCSPYADRNHEIDQFVQSCMRLLKTATPELAPQSVVALLQNESLRWRSESAEPLDHGLIPTVLFASEENESLDGVWSELDASV